MDADKNWLLYAVAWVAGTLLVSALLFALVFVAGWLLATCVEVAVQLLMAVLYR